MSNMDYFHMAQPTSHDVISTAGAVPVRNEKGEISMQRVKVHRYVSGKRPEYAPHSSSEDESDDDDFIEARKHGRAQSPLADRADDDDDGNVDDPRLRRLRSLHVEKSDRHRRDDDEEDDVVEVDRTDPVRRRRRIHEPEVIESDRSESDADDYDVRRVRAAETSEEEEEEELSDSEIERRRLMLKERVLSAKEQQEVELLDKEDEGQSEEESEEESSEDEEDSDSEEETGVRLKPVFVRKKERVTIFEKEKDAQKKKEFEIESKKMAEERKKQTLKMVEDEIRKETNRPTRINGELMNLNDVNTDDENDEIEYEAWKQRELKRVKRDREEREQLEKEKIEIERLRNMTEEERRNDARVNPRQITNKSTKGKYKFMQKYYHRGVFFMDKEDDVYRRDFSEATLEDHFDKTILPRVMQVKNFGRSGRTKYTHLVDQDTTQFDSPWITETTHNIKFHHDQAAGCKQVFDRPSNKRKKSSN
ncbi:microfibrillar-associated protein [Nesidiocoris tenuis]|uniref:Microfibrillar-associated protein n=1 Tax=Nesidiocoris tenuis TaxID=355587 RepID=A0ABN7BA61_9HEMI|nr:microfibrillar-associated protein [Nesidiocoris tenuis]